MSKGPRRRIVLELHAGADSWRDMQFVLRTLSDEIARDGELSRSSVSGGYSSGWRLTSSEDEAITHDSWAEANEAYCATLRGESNEG